MDDKTIASPEMAEYKFTGSDDVPVAAEGEEVPAAALSSGFVGKINWRKLIVSGIIIVAVFLLYGFLSFYNNRSARVAEQQKIQAQEVVTTQPDIIATPPQSQPSPSVLSSDQITQIQTAVQQKISLAEDGISNNRDQLASLNTAVSKAQQDISSLGHSIEQLLGVTQQLLVEIQQLKAPKVKVTKKAVKSLPIYHVRAIVPGRVWLESAEGKGVTLRVGDKLDGYGTVDIISPQEGMVLMSNGSSIQYGINDF